MFYKKCVCKALVPTHTQFRLSCRGEDKPDRFVKRPQQWWPEFSETLFAVWPNGRHCLPNPDHSVAN